MTNQTSTANHLATDQRTTDQRTADRLTIDPTDQVEKGRTDRSPSIRRLDPARHLPLVLAANATTSGLAGLLAVADSRWVADRIGLDGTGWIQAVGAGLLLFAGAVAAASRLRGRNLARSARAIAAADLAWVAASVAVVEAAELSTFGVVAALVMALGVLDFALVQLWLAARLARVTGR